jgi:hypothetical protein
MLLFILIERSMADKARLYRAFAHNLQTQIPNLIADCKDDLIMAPILPHFYANFTKEKKDSSSTNIGLPNNRFSCRPPQNDRFVPS